MVNCASRARCIEGALIQGSLWYSDYRSMHGMISFIIESPISMSTSTVLVWCSTLYSLQSTQQYGTSSPPARRGPLSTVLVPYGAVEGSKERTAYGTARSRRNQCTVRVGGSRSLLEQREQIEDSRYCTCIHNTLRPNEHLRLYSGRMNGLQNSLAPRWHFAVSGNR